MRLIDADAMRENLLWCKGQSGSYDDYWDDVIERLDAQPTVDVLQTLWNALYAEEDKLEKRYFGTPEHDNWFLIYRPWLQDGFGIAIKAMSEILTPEPPEEGEVG